MNDKKDYDIAVITIAGSITFTNEVGPACLPFQHYLDSYGGSFVDVLGKNKYIILSINKRRGKYSIFFFFYKVTIEEVKKKWAQNFCCYFATLF